MIKGIFDLSSSTQDTPVAKASDRRETKVEKSSKNSDSILEASSSSETKVRTVVAVQIESESSAQ